MSSDLTHNLNKVLADIHVIYFKTHVFHWNVQGPEFMQLHKLFEEQYNALFMFLDEVAERIRALDAPTLMSLKDILANTAIQEQTKIPAPHGMLEDLVKDYKKIIATLKELLTHAAHDPVTADLLTQLLVFFEKHLWFLESHLV